MPSEESRAARQTRMVLSEHDITDALNDSEIDFSGDDSDEDPVYSPPEFLRQSNHDSNSSSDDDEVGLEVPVPSPAISCDSEIVPSTSASRVTTRGRARSTTRRGRGRTCTRRSSNLRTRSSPSLRLNNNLLQEQEDNWAADNFVPEVLNFTFPAYYHLDTTTWEWNKYYDQYIDDEILLTMVESTNRVHILETGKSLGLTLKELKTYIGITMIMSALQYPQIDMYWLHKWKIPAIAMAMNRNRFYFIRKRLKCVYDPDVTAEQRKEKFWKIKPLFDRILQGCHMQERPKDLCIDEMTIPFTGRCPMRQYCPGKPNPVGLKVFVLASPQGVVCDMGIYQGDNSFPDQKSQGFGLGESAVLFLTRTLVAGHLLFFDRYFTTVKLCVELLRLGFHATGTIMKNRVPRDCVLTEERLFRKEQRGSTEVKVREGGKLALTRWLDNKPVLMMSSCYSNENHDECERWSKKDSRYEKVMRPEVIKMYNQNMGGVDLTDRMLSVCPSRNRTKKWTIRAISHLFDLCVVNSWLQYREQERQKETPKKNVMQLRQYKLELGTKFITDNENQSDDEIDQVYEEMEPKHKMRKVVVKPIPIPECRQHKADHLPEYSTAKQHRCRRRGCDKRTTVLCKKCDVFLCFVPGRNCLTQFHEIDF